MFIISKDISTNKFIEVVNPVKVTSKDHYIQNFINIKHKGGEGIIFRKPGSFYMQHDSFLKYVVS